MRRTIPTLLAAGVLLTAAACGTATDQTGPATGTPGAVAASAPSVPAAIRSTCEALGQAYGRNMAALAESLTNLVADPANTPRAQASLAAFGAAIENATKASDDTQLRADGKQTADRMRTTSADPKFFRAIKTTGDVAKTMGPTLTGWLSPVSRHCS